jgi:hypothetical protein
MDWSRLGTIAIAAVLLIGGSIRVAQEGRDGFAFLAAGMILLGVWIAVELHDRYRGGG